jgi:hypothetical protein
MSSYWKKRENALNIRDYQAISIMHNITKLLTKILANRLAPHLDQIVSYSQSAFIRGRSIHDNFQYVQGAANHFHNVKTLMLLLKLDITKAFDNVRWEYKLELLQQLGFSQCWRDILSLIWSTMTSRIMVPGNPIKHARGLCQGDPLSPMLFILAINPPLKLLDMATEEGLLTPIGTYLIKMRTNLYVDDAML